MKSDRFTVLKGDFRTSGRFCQFNERTVPYTMSETLFQAANVPKKLLLVESAGHVNVSAIAPEKYAQTLQEFEQLVNQNQKQLAL